MAYKNSGAMKFNDATDLVIRADPDGTVESVYNLADSTEYITQYSNPVNVNVKINNTTASSVPVYAVYLDSGVITSRRVNVAAGGYANVAVIKGSKNTVGSGSTITLDSGDITIDTLTFTAESDGEITIS